MTDNKKKEKDILKFKLANKKLNSVDLYQVILDADKDNPEAHVAFLQPDTIVILKEYFSGTVDEVEKKMTTESLRQKWGLILIDAIYFLRINDHREASFYENTKTRVKTKMGSNGVRKVAEANIYGIKELCDYFAQFTEFENTLYGADKYYRDHVIHPINVWLTGIKVLKVYGDRFAFRSVGKEYATIEDSTSAKPEWFLAENHASPMLKLSTAELSAMWAIIALTHDLGYPLEKVDKINDQLEKMLSQFGSIGFSRSHFSFENQHDHLVKFLLKLISSVCSPQIESKKADEDYKWTNHLRTKYYTKFAKSWEQFDHGIVSCLLLLKTLTYFIESDYSSENSKALDSEDARQFAIRSEILHAIASHTTPKIYHLDVNNLAFLLVFCDDIQEWSRPTLTDIRSGIKGSAEKVTIEKFYISTDGETTKQKHSEIVALIDYPDKISFDDQKQFVKRIFNKWVERLRPALEDTDRSFQFTWKMSFGGKLPWIFKLDNLDDSVLLKIKIKFLKQDKDTKNISYECDDDISILYS